MKLEITKMNGQQVPKKYAEIRLLTIDDINKLIELQDLVIANMTVLEMFEPDNEKFYIKHISEKGIIFGCLLSNRLIAYGVMAIPGLDKDNLGYDLYLPNSELKQVAHLESIVVHPMFRGNGLQVLLCNLIEKKAIEQGCKHLCATVHPNNHHSLSNILSLGLEVKKCTLKYGGKERYILHKYL